MTLARAERTTTSPPGGPIRRRWGTWLCWALVGLAAALVVRTDLAHLDWGARLSQEGSPPPALDLDSPTGYTLDQRHFLGTVQRGETYRWIAATQAFLNQGLWASSEYDADTVPTGRIQFLPRVYAAWLASLAWLAHPLDGAPRPVAVERIALWEPVIAHLIALLAAAALMARRVGAGGAAIIAWLFALFPALFSQFIPGALNADTWALLTASLAVALTLRPPSPGQPSFALSPGSALAAGFALWLNPAFGFPAVLILSAAGAASSRAGPPPIKFVRWAVIGAGVVTLGWLINRGPCDPVAAELRHVHPHYAFAWLGLGLGLHGWQRRRHTKKDRTPAVLAAVAGLMLLAPLVLTQLRHGFLGWLHPTADLRRFASLDASRIFNHVFDWVGQASFAEVVLLTAPLLGAAAVLLGGWYGRGPAARIDRAWLAAATLALAGLLVMTGFKVRWSVPATLVAVMLLGYLSTRASPLWRRVMLGSAGVFFFSLIAWSRALPDTLRSFSPPSAPVAADLEALVFRHFSHWLASRSGGLEVRVLAPPALADSIVFHGGGRVLLSTAWESHPGHVAAARILSAPESTEAEAVIESLGLTHLVLTSWDGVLPLLVKAPLEQGRDTLHARLQRWVLPRYVRPLPYRLPATPGFKAEKLVVLQVVPPQDEALALSRLAEYFVEVERPEPAGLVAVSLQQAFPEDPNAAMARALVHEAAGNRAGFEAELSRLVGNVEAVLVPLDWNRRIVRAIILALGKRHDLARAEITAGCDTMSDEGLRQLTPRQAFQLRKLIELYRLTFPTEELAALARALSLEYKS